MTPQDELIERLQALGWEMDGETRTEIVRVPTIKSPRFGKSGGELRKFGGRIRLHYPGSIHFITVGQRGICHYHKIGSEVSRATMAGTRAVTAELAALWTQAAFLDAATRAEKKSTK